MPMLPPCRRRRGSQRGNVAQRMMHDSVGMTHTRQQLHRAGAPNFICRSHLHWALAASPEMQATCHMSPTTCYT
eukprot:scaffold28067_cov162-Isochrysis_galbana.AAC.2